MWFVKEVKSMIWIELTEEYACGVLQAGRNFEKKDASNRQRDLIQRTHKAAGCSLVIRDVRKLVLSLIQSYLK